MRSNCRSPMLGKKHSDETRRKMSERKKGRKYFLIPRETRICICGCGETFECKINSVKKYYSAGHVAKTNEDKARKSLKLKERWVLDKEGMIENSIKSNKNPEVIERKRQATINHWKNPNSYNKHIEKHWAYSNRRDEVIKKSSDSHKIIAKTNPYNSREFFINNVCAKSHKNKEINKKEQQLLDILNKLFPNEYKFVGGFEVMIGGYYPDFINVNGQKKIVEMFGDYWHRNSQEKDANRLKQYAVYGYDTLVVWEKELKNKSLLEKRLICFNNEKE